MKILNILVITTKLFSQMSSEKSGVPLNGTLSPESKIPEF